MSAKQKIAKLEALLARVNERAAAPRTITPLEEVAFSPHEVTTSRGDRASLSPPPPALAKQASAPPARPISYAPDVEVEVTSEVVELDIDEPMAMESGAQPVGHQAEDADYGFDEDAEEEVVATIEVSEPPPAMPTEVTATAANELEEPTPSSSRRPIAAEVESYEEPSAPRHTPPPESGKQVAAAPSAQPPRRSTHPPDSVEGHTLIGGWREPGVPREGMVPNISTGVRVPAPPPAAGTPAAQPPAAPAPRPVAVSAAVPPPASMAGGPPAAAGPPRITADVTRGQLPGIAKVGTFEGQAPNWKPANFGELLDASLEL